MFAKFSVKKPFTVLVVVLLILVLGYVSVGKMTPDLLPDMSFPYVVLFTSVPTERTAAKSCVPTNFSAALLGKCSDCGRRELFAPALGAGRVGQHAGDLPAAARFFGLRCLSARSVFVQEKLQCLCRRSGTPCV